MYKKNSFSMDLIFNVFNYIVMVLFAFICVYPFYYVLIYSISDPTQVGKGIMLFPRGFSIATYTQMLTQNDIYTSLSVSVLRTVIGTSLTVLCCSLFAYLVTHKDLPFRKVIYRFVVITMYLDAGLIPWYITMSTLGLRNNFLAYILPYCIAAYNLILIKTYIEQLPSSLQESAEIDGAGVLTIYSRIILPLCKPIIATIAVFSSLMHWNMWKDNYFLISTQNLQTLQMVLYTYLSEAQSIAFKSMNELSRGDAKNMVSAQSVKMAITIIVTLPIIFVYPFMQKHFVKGILIGAVKG